MTKWEYRVELADIAVDGALHAIGQEYWELVAATDRFLYFKRPYRAHPVKNTEGWSGPVKAKG